MQKFPILANPFFTQTRVNDFLNLFIIFHEGIIFNFEWLGYPTCEDLPILSLPFCDSLLIT